MEGSPRPQGARPRHQPPAAARVVVVGGSLGGLNAALWLRDAGVDVEVYERSRSPLEGRGAGIVLHPATVRYLIHHRLLNLDQISAPARWMRYLERSGLVAHEAPSRYRFTSWTALYRAFLACLPRDRYHLGEEVVGFEQDAGGVTVRFEGGRRERGDLLVCADGTLSTARRILEPQAAPRYVGYVGWRGTVEEPELTPQTFAVLRDAVTYFLLRNGHILAYPIPGADESPAAGRPINWVWYRNVAEGPDLEDLMTDPHGTRHAVSLPPGSVRERHVREVRAAALDQLPPPLAEMVAGTARPFIQAVVDAEVPRMAFGRICLIGDAAFTLRPHAGPPARPKRRRTPGSWPRRSGPAPVMWPRRRSAGSPRSSPSAGRCWRGHGRPETARSSRGRGGSATRCPSGCTGRATAQTSD